MHNAIFFSHLYTPTSIYFLQNVDISIVNPQSKNFFPSQRHTYLIIYTKFIIILGVLVMVIKSLT